nr:S41 family peptidase [Ferruginibacter sp.]
SGRIRIRTHLLNQQVIYVQVPGIQAQGEQVNRMAQALSDSICRYSQLQPKGFIIDLRLNMGGQLSVMLSGLQPLLGNGYIGGGVDLTQKETKRFEMVAGNLEINKKAMTSIWHQCQGSFEQMPVAVLIGPVTASSGSITAIAFKQRPNTIFIGEPTADGYSTGNDYFYFTENLLLNLSTEYSQDRKGIVYTHSVHPDLLIDGDVDFDNQDKDPGIKAALNWFRTAYDR